MCSGRRHAPGRVRPYLPLHPYFVTTRVFFMAADRAYTVLPRYVASRWYLPGRSFFAPMAQLPLPAFSVITQTVVLPAVTATWPTGVPPVTEARHRHRASPRPLERR